MFHAHSLYMLVRFYSRNWSVCCQRVAVDSFVGATGVSEPCHQRTRFAKQAVTSHSALPCVISVGVVERFGRFLVKAIESPE
jgi:hypothetical protein